jgi:choline dehydrogenase-like flavoprotein
VVVLQGSAIFEVEDVRYELVGNEQPEYFAQAGFDDVQAIKFHVVFMILDAKNFQEAPDFLDAPVVIVGAGTVGLFLAVSLARAKIPTVVVETGGYVADTSRSRQTAVSLGRPHAGATLGRAFGLGGTSALWAGQLAEFDEMDLIAPGREWPIEYSELQRWYEHVYAFLKVNPVKLAANTFEAVGKQNEYGIERFVTTWMPRPNFAQLFRADIYSNPLLKVILNATANDILFEGSKATAVCVGVPSGRKITISGRAFVFASGTLETNRFFLSTQRRSDVPWRHNKNIGAYFQDHLSGQVAHVRILDERKFRDYFESGLVSGIKLTPKLRNSSGFNRPAYSGAVGFFSCLSRLQENFDNLKLLGRTFRSGIDFSKFRTLPADLWSLGGALFPLAVRFARDQRIMALMDRGVDFIIQSEQIPTAESVVRLIDEEPQQDGLFRLAVHWNLDGAEIANIRDFVRRVDEYLRQEKIATLEIDERLLRGDPSILEQFEDHYHQVGGMWIGGSASSGVVDSDCRVWGTANVYVAGASVFPTSSHANITLTALALTARLASFLEKRSSASRLRNRQSQFRKLDLAARRYLPEAR